jgi:hypothetical protein
VRVPAHTTHIADARANAPIGLILILFEERTVDLVRSHCDRIAALSRHQTSRAHRGIVAFTKSLLLHQPKKFFKAAWCEHQGCGQGRAEPSRLVGPERAPVHIPATGSAETPLEPIVDTRVHHGSNRHRTGRRR